jgi:uncharacterized protein YcbK (DUF882 family)
MLNRIIRVILIPIFIIVCANQVNAYSGKTGGLNPRLAYLLRRIEAHFAHPLKVTSGCRSHAHNRSIGGARESWHLRCMAADVELAGINKVIVAHFASALPGRGGIGTYCHDRSIHVDLGPRREWYWGCSGQRSFSQGGFHRYSVRGHRQSHRRH